MKKVVLLGDSIRMGYDKYVKEALSGVAEVYYPSENCKFAEYMLRFAHEWKKNGQWPDDVELVHWNAGLWDCLRLFGEEPHTPVEVYAYYIDRICLRIKKLFPDAAVIFATSTQVQSERMADDFKRYNEEIQQYNAAAVAVVEKYGFAVNDLYAVSAALPGEAHSDPVHYYTPAGTEAFTNQVLSFLTPLLGLEENIVYREALHTDAPVGI